MTPEELMERYLGVKGAKGKEVSTRRLLLTSDINRSNPALVKYIRWLEREVAFCHETHYE